MRIELNEKAARKLAMLQDKFRNRKIKKATWEHIISDILCQRSEKAWQRSIDERTPASYFIEQALCDPSKQNALMDFAKKLMKAEAKSKEAVKGKRGSLDTSGETNR